MKSNLVTTKPFLSSCLYQIAHLGDDDEETEFSSAMPLEEGDTFFYAPRPLRNLVLVDELDSLSPIMACQVLALIIIFLRNSHHHVHAFDELIFVVRLLAMMQP